MAFKKGDPNINRNGRPKKGFSMQEILEKILDEGFEGSDHDKREAVCRIVIDQALNSESWAIKELLDRLYGKPRQAIDQTITNETPPSIHLVIRGEEPTEDEA